MVHKGWFTYVNCEARVPVDHALRPVPAIGDEAREALSAAFAELYASTCSY